MARGTLGIIVAGGSGPLDALGQDDDAALTPFGGRYRLIDFALATLANSGVTPAHVLAPSATPGLCVHLARARRAGAALPRPFLLALPGPRPMGHGRAARIARALAAGLELARRQSAETLVVLTADHILQVDVRDLLAAHHQQRGDVTLAAGPPRDAQVPLAFLRLDADGRVAGVCADEPPGLALAWTGDLVIRVSALTALLEATRGATAGDLDFLAAMARSLRLVACDVLETHLPGARHGSGAFWHEPTSVEAYYAAQMDLCTLRPSFDLFNPSWPVLPVASGLGPAKIVADAAGRPGQALNSLLSDGVVVRGGVAVNTVLGHGVVIDSCAEVEDSVLLDACYVGRGARVRRAIVGAGAVIADGAEIGYEQAPAAPARLAPSGLTLVRSLPLALVAAGGAR